MYEVGTAASFKAWHVMPGMEGPEGELHEHDYKLEVVAGRPELDDRGMVCDLDVLDEAMREVVAAVEGKDLDVIRPPQREAVTVEVLAKWAHGELARALAATGVAHLAVRVWESPVAFGRFSGPVAQSSS